MVLVNNLRSAFSSWHDRVLGPAALLIAIVGLRASLADRPFVIAASLIVAAGGVIGIGAARLIHWRLGLHGYDGTLATDALQPRLRRRYSVSWHLVVLGGFCAAVLIARPGLIAVGLAGYAAGALIGYATNRLLEMPRFAGRLDAGRTIRTYLRRPTAGLVGAVVVLVLLIPAYGLETGAQFGTAGVFSAIAVLCLTDLDDAAIQFMTFSGYGTWSIVGVRARGTLIFLAITLPVCLLAFPPEVAGAVAGVAAAGLVLMYMRILAYRILSKRKADTVVTICLGAIAIAAMTAPMLVPLVLAAILWQLQRRSATTTWMLP